MTSMRIVRFSALIASGLALASCVSHADDPSGPTTYIPAVSDEEMEISIRHFQHAAKQTPPVYTDPVREARIREMRARQAEYEAQREANRLKRQQRQRQIEAGRRNGSLQGQPFDNDNRRYYDNPYATGDYQCPVKGLTQEAADYFEIKLNDAKAAANKEKIDAAFLLTTDIVSNPSFLPRLTTAFSGKKLQPLNLEQHPAFNCINEIAAGFATFKKDELDTVLQIEKLASILLINDALMTLRELVSQIDEELGNGRFDGYILDLYNKTEALLPRTIQAKRTSRFISDRPVQFKNAVPIVDPRAKKEKRVTELSLSP